MHGFVLNLPPKHALARFLTFGALAIMHSAFKIRKLDVRS